MWVLSRPAEGTFFVGFAPCSLRNISRFVELHHEYLEVVGVEVPEQVLVLERGIHYPRN